MAVLRKWDLCVASRVWLSAQSQIRGGPWSSLSAAVNALKAPLTQSMGQAPYGSPCTHSCVKLCASRAHADREGKAGVLPAHPTETASRDKVYGSLRQDKAVTVPACWLGVAGITLLWFVSTPENRIQGQAHVQNPECLGSNYIMNQKMNPRDPTGVIGLIYETGLLESDSSRLPGSGRRSRIRSEDTLYHWLWR